jgi:hypothetical protein
MVCEGDGKNNGAILASMFGGYDGEELVLGQYLTDFSHSTTMTSSLLPLANLSTAQPCFLPL